MLKKNMMNPLNFLVKNIKNSFLLLFITLISFPSLSDDEEVINLLSCENVNFINESFIYPVDIIEFSHFLMGKNNKYTVYKMKFLIDPEFKFPKKSFNKPFSPFKSKKIEIICYNDEMPRMISYLYESGKPDNKNISIYLSKSENFNLKIVFKQ